MHIQKVWRKLFRTYVILGIINLLLAFFFFYRSSIDLVEERAQEQLKSVSALASQQLNFYFDHLKNKSIQSTQASEVFSDPSLVSGFVIKNDRVSKIFGKDHPTSDFSEYKELQFYSFEKEFFLLKVPSFKKTFIWIFNAEGLNHVLGQREGLGDSGEMYLVGPDRKIKSGSRHVRDWKDVVINNESLDKAQQKKFGVHSVKDYRGINVLSSYSDFRYDELKYTLLSEIDKAEILRPLNKVFPRILLLCLFVFIITLVVGIFSSKRIITIIKEMRNQLNQFNLNIINALEQEKKKLAELLSGSVMEEVKCLDDKMTTPEEVQKTGLRIKEELETVVSNLQTLDFSSVGLYSAIQDFLIKESKLFHVEVGFWFNQRLNEVNFRDDLKMNIYRMVQDLIQRSFVQSKPDQLSMVISKQTQEILFRFEFVGKEIQEEKLLYPTVQYRVELLGGRMNLVKEAHSSVLKIYLPIDPLLA